MRLRCDFSTPVARTDMNDYVRHLVITIENFGKDYELYVVGKLAMDQILWNDALVDGVPFSKFATATRKQCTRPTSF